MIRNAVKKGNPYHPHVLIVGLGSIGLRHLKNVRSLGIADVSVVRQKGRSLPEQVDVSGMKIFPSIQDALKHHSYDAAIVCNPTSMHLQTAMALLRAGCHLYIEKPVADSVEGTEALIKLIRDRHLNAMVGCQFRFHPHLIQIESWLMEGKIGKILHCHVDCGEYLPFWHPWEDYRQGYAAQKELGGGVVLTLIHELDYLTWLFGPLNLTAAFGGCSGALELDVEDNVTCMFSNKMGTPITMHLDYPQHPPCREMKIIGSQGQIRWNYFEKFCQLSVRGQAEVRLELPDSWDRNELFLSAMKHFLDCIETGKGSRVPVEESVDVLRIAMDIKSYLKIVDENGPAHE